MKRKFIAFVCAGLFGAISLHAQQRPARAASAPTPAATTKAGPKSSGDYQADAAVLIESQEQALEMVRGLKERATDPRTQTQLATVEQEMEKALARLSEATNSPATLPQALAAEQAAYQALLKLAAREYQVSRSRSQKGAKGASGGQRNQKQLDQLELKQNENRYETQRQATPQQSAEQREQLQVLNRLKELARRQQDLNERLKELQTALQEARTEEEKEAARRQLKRLREEQQKMVQDIDELRQRMDQPENQSRMAESRQQLDQTRSEASRAADELEKGAVSQALASGTRAQRELQELRDEFRKKSSGQFSDEMRQLRSDARELAQKQEEIGGKMDAGPESGRKTLTDPTNHKDLAAQLDEQKKRMTNVLDRATTLSEQSETAEPLLSRQLYDTIRKASQDEAKNLTETRDELLQSGRLTRGVYDMLETARKEGGNKSLEITAELLRKGQTAEASLLEQRARRGIEELKQGVERAAESVLGDELEALRLARKELEDLTQQAEKEMAQADGANAQGEQKGAGSRQGQPQTAQRDGSGQQTKPSSESPDGQQPGQQARAGEQPDPSGKNQKGKGGQAQSGQRGGQPGDSPSANSENQSPAQQAQQNAAGQPGGQTGQGQQNRDGNPQAQSGQQRDGSRQRGGPASLAGGGGGNYDRTAGGWDGFRNWLERDGDRGPGGPITGADYTQWAERLRDVEEMIDTPELRNQVAAVRERAQVLRLEFKRHSKKPEWALVKAQIVEPLAEVRSRIGEELARRESKDSLVPIDRDPVPNRFSDLVRRYYEELGKSQ